MGGTRPSRRPADAGLFGSRSSPFMSRVTVVCLFFLGLVGCGELVRLEAGIAVLSPTAAGGVGRGWDGAATPLICDFVSVPVSVDCSHPERCVHTDAVRL